MNFSFDGLQGTSNGLLTSGNSAADPNVLKTTSASFRVSPASIEVTAGPSSTEIGVTAASHGKKLRLALTVEHVVQLQRHLTGGHELAHDKEVPAGGRKNL
jgi:hypothetical protein